MRDDHDHWLGTLASCLTFLLVLTACAIHYLPSDVALVAVSWTMLSMSVSVFFGHCVLNDH